MTYQSVNMSDLYCDGCGLGLLLAPQQDETAVSLRAMAREDGWTVRRKERNRLGNLVGTLDLCGECSNSPSGRSTGSETDRITLQHMRESEPSGRSTGNPT